MLALAKSGEMRAVAFASVMKSGDIHTGFEREAGQKFALGGAVLQMSYRYAALVNGET